MVTIGLHISELIVLFYLVEVRLHTLTFFSDPYTILDTSLSPEQVHVVQSRKHETY